jgi:deoxyribonuclease V
VPDLQGNVFSHKREVTVMMILAVDVDYRHDRAVAAGVLFNAWNAITAVQEIRLDCQITNDYVPGEFYRRELPCILNLLKKLNKHVDIIVIDGFVYLGEERRPGLGMVLYERLKGKVAVIGVAKSAFKDTPASTELLRGSSQRPLYVTAIGIEEDVARQAIQQMYGKNRLPTLLKQVDRLCREHG